MKFDRTWSMPASDTFDSPPIGEFVKRHLAASKCSIDPFSRNKRWATFTNDLNPRTAAEFHMQAVDFLEHLKSREIRADLVILDPPYSPRQISECYKEAGITAGMADTQNSALYSRVKAAAFELLTADATVLCFGWNSIGMGKKYEMEISEILLVCHGGGHNDTICMAEKRRIDKKRQPTLSFVP